MTKTILLALLVGATTSASGGQLLNYDIRNARSSDSSIPAQIVAAGISASSLTPVNLIPARGCCEDGPGWVTWSGWDRVGNPGLHANAHADFSITAGSQGLRLDYLEFSWFSSLYSDAFNAPNRLTIWLSWDNFVTGNALDTLGYLETPPGAWRGPKYSQAKLDLIVAPGITVSFRFIAWAEPWTWDMGAGPLNVLEGNRNLALYGNTIAPEPMSMVSIFGGLILIALLRRLRTAV